VGSFGVTLTNDVPISRLAAFTENGLPNRLNRSIMSPGFPSRLRFKLHLLSFVVDSLQNVCTTSCTTNQKKSHKPTGWAKTRQHFVRLIISSLGSEGRTRRVEVLLQNTR